MFYSLYTDVAKIGKRTEADRYDSLVPFCVQPTANFVKYRYKSLYNACHTKPRIIIQRFRHFVSSFRFVEYRKLCNHNRNHTAKTRVKRGNRNRLHSDIGHIIDPALDPSDSLIPISSYSPRFSV